MKVINESLLGNQDDTNIQEILNEMIFLCSMDSSDSKILTKTEQTVKEYESKILKYDNLLLKSDQMKKEILQKKKLLEDENISKKIKLLESLGSEL